MSTIVDQDAHEFGLHDKQGGWRLGLLVARSVENRGPGNPHGNFSTEKLTASAFAKIAGTSTARVLRYLKAWDAAALDVWVPESTLLVPGEELDNFPPELDWSEVYDSTEGDSRYDRISNRDQLKEQAKADGVGHTKVLDIAKNTRAMAAAIKADPAVAVAARDAIAQREAKRKNVTDPHGKQDSPIDQLVQSHIRLRSAKRSLVETLGYVLEMRGVTDADEVRAAVSGYVQQLRHVLDLIDEAAQGTSLDDELAELLADEDLR